MVTSAGRGPSPPGEELSFQKEKIEGLWVSTMEPHKNNISIVGRNGIRNIIITISPKLYNILIPINKSFVPIILIQKYNYVKKFGKYMTPNHRLSIKTTLQSVKTAELIFIPRYKVSKQRN